MDKERLIKALETIKLTCEEYSCETCPLGTSYGGCLLGIKDYPNEWELNNKEMVWRAIIE